jgi:hypothetical protein
MTQTKSRRRRDGSPGHKSSVLCVADCVSVCCVLMSGPWGRLSQSVPAMQYIGPGGTRSGRACGCCCCAVMLGVGPWSVERMRVCTYRAKPCHFAFLWCVPQLGGYSRCGTTGCCLRHVWHSVVLQYDCCHSVAWGCCVAVTGVSMLWWHHAKLVEASSGRANWRCTVLRAFFAGRVLGP